MPKLTKFGIKLCSLSFRLAVQLGVSTHGAVGLDSQTRDLREILRDFSEFSFLVHFLVKLDHFHQSLSSPSS